MEATCDYEVDDNLLYLANSKDLIKYIKRLRVDTLYSNLLDTAPVEAQGKLNGSIEL
jgi:hypothetical protein